jgi:Zn-finger protein
MNITKVKYQITKKVRFRKSGQKKSAEINQCHSVGGEIGTEIDCSFCYKHIYNSVNYRQVYYIQHASVLSEKIKDL